MHRAVSLPSRGTHRSKFQLFLPHPHRRPPPNHPPPTPGFFFLFLALAICPRDGWTCVHTVKYETCKHGWKPSFAIPANAQESLIILARVVQRIARFVVDFRRFCSGVLFHGLSIALFTFPLHFSFTEKWLSPPLSPSSSLSSINFPARLFLLFDNPSPWRPDNCGAYRSYRQ